MSNSLSETAEDFFGGIKAKVAQANDLKNTKIYYIK